MNIEKTIDEIYPELVTIRRHFHMFPEISEYEFETKEKICDLLKKWGIEYTEAKNCNGVVALIKGNSPGKTVAVRADMDALPLEEKTEIEYKSKKSDAMHACGHDIHTTVLLGVAYVVKKYQSEISGNVKLIFQPAEETVGGAEKLINEGCMINPEVDYVLGLHVQPFVEAGKIELKYNEFYASTDEFDIEVLGKTSHGAYPEKSVDAIYIASCITNALYGILARNIAPTQKAAISIGTINGGAQRNIIADKVTIQGIIRTFDDNTRIFIKNRIKQIASNIAQAYNGKCNITIDNGFRQIINNNEIVDIIRNTAEKAIGVENIVIREEPTLCGEDFSYYLENTKGAFYHLGCGYSDMSLNEPLHSNKFCPNEECIKIGVLIQTKSILALLNK